MLCIGGLTLGMLQIPQKLFGLAWMVFLELCTFSVSPAAVLLWAPGWWLVVIQGKGNKR